MSPEPVDECPVRVLMVGRLASLSVDVKIIPPISGQGSARGCDDPLLGRSGDGPTTKARLAAGRYGPAHAGKATGSQPVVLRLCAALKFEEDVIGWGIPMPESRGKSSIKATLRTQVAVTRQYCVGSGRARIFYSYTDRCRQDATAKGR